MKRSRKRVLCVITARGGSKGIPRKNLALLCGKPLLQYAIESALAANLLSKVVLSTDDLEIAELGKKLRIEVPFIRPKKLARDETPTLPALKHAVRFLEREGEKYDAICLLQPTNPLVEPHDIDNCVRIFFKKLADTIMSVSEVPCEYNPNWVYFKRKNGTLYLSTNRKNPPVRRQLLPPAFHRKGSIYIVKRDILIKKNTLYGKKLIGYLIPSDNSVNIDCPEDLIKADTLLRRRRAAPSNTK